MRTTFHEQGSNQSTQTICGATCMNRRQSELCLFLITVKDVLFVGATLIFTSPSFITVTVEVALFAMQRIRAFQALARGLVAPARQGAAAASRLVASTASAQAPARNSTVGTFHVLATAGLHRNRASWKIQ